jgi:hypothetical protein
MDIESQTIRDRGDQTIAEVTPTRICEHMLRYPASLQPILGDYFTIVDNPKSTEKSFGQVHLFGVRYPCQELDFNRANDGV